MRKVKFDNVETVQGKVFRNQLVTLNDLAAFKMELLSEIETLFNVNSGSPQRKWLKSYEVRALLNISPGTLQTLRTKGILPFTRMGGTIYYDKEDIHRLLASQKSVRPSLKED
jgi:hypothetical protein